MRRSSVSLFNPSEIADSEPPKELVPRGFLLSQPVAGGVLAEDQC